GSDMCITDTYYPLLTSFVEHFNFKPNGVPIVKIKEWRHNSGTLEFDFCFPIVRTDSLPQVEFITYKTFKKQRVLKAEYFGNYFTSDRAWYELIQYANKNGYKVDHSPIEYFYTNPTTGINESDWKAEIFLPIQN
ncbi:GyrI-like domain-containing protein, partial [Chryseosolibacter indicus]